MTNLLDEALEYVRRGWYVLPCREKPGQAFMRAGETIIPEEKTPYIAKGLHAASNDEDQIRAWWQMWPNALIGVNAGKSGLFVLDIDKKHVNGLDTYSQWNINDTASLQSITPSGGMHIIFSGKGKSSTNAETGIDTRGEGGYFIVPPSKVLDGEYTGEYKRFNDWSNAPGVIPDGLMSKLFPDTTLNFDRGTTPIDGTKKQLSRKTLNFIISGAQQGERNTLLFHAAADFYGCGYTQEETKTYLTPAVEKMKFSEAEFNKVLQHAYSKPRTPSIPDSIQEKIMEAGKDAASKITPEEQSVMENAVLACMMIDNTCIPVIQDILNFDDFRIAKNRYIYRKINSLYASGVKADYLTVSNEISKENSKITLDDISKLTSQYYINVDNAVSYSLIIKEKSSIYKLEALLDNKDKYIKGNLVDGVATLEKDISDIAIEGGVASTAVLTGEQAVEATTQRTEALINGEIEQLKTGFIVYDNDIGGIFQDEAIMIAGRSGEGKSAMLLSILNEVSIRQGQTSVFFTLEMSTHETICRLICQLTGIPYKNVYQGKMNAEQWKEYALAKKRIAQSPIHFDDTPSMSVPQMRSKLRKLSSKGIKLVGIDQLEQVGGNEGLPLYQQFDRNAYGIATIPKEFGIPVILNHQMNRNITNRQLVNKEPILSDLNQAGEKPMHQVWIISHLKDDKGNILKSKVKMLKNRNGARIEFAVEFVGPRMLFSNPVRKEDMEVFHETGNTEEETDNSYQDKVNNNIHNTDSRGDLPF